MLLFVINLNELIPGMISHSINWYLIVVIGASMKLNAFFCHLVVFNRNIFTVLTDHRILQDWQTNPLGLTVCDTFMITKSSILTVGKRFDLSLMCLLHGTDFWVSLFPWSIEPNYCQPVNLPGNF